MGIQTEGSPLGVGLKRLEGILQYVAELRFKNYFDYGEVVLRGYSSQMGEVEADNWSSYFMYICNFMYD